MVPRQLLMLASIFQGLIWTATEPMSRYSELMQRIQAGECILIDGATGTEMERRGVPQLDNAWNGGGALSHPEILRAVHEDYLRLGAEIIISNTFATHFYALRDAGEAESFEDYNRRGIEIAIEARENMQKPDALVAGGISYWSWSGNHPSLENLKAATDRQVEIIAAAGADLFMLEMMIDIDKMLLLLDSAASTGLPVWVLVILPGPWRSMMSARPRTQASGSELVIPLPRQTRSGTTS